MPGRDPLTEQQIADVLRGIPRVQPRRASMYQALFALSVGTGARISEILRLNRRDLISPKGCLIEKITFKHTKNGESRRVKMNPIMTPYIVNWLIDQEEMGLVTSLTPIFVNRSGGRLSRVWAWRVLTRALKELCDESGLWGTHTGRKTFGKYIYQYYSQRLRDGDNIDPLIKTQEALGHKKLDSTKAYLAFMFGETDKAVLSLYSGLARN